MVVWKAKVFFDLDCLKKIRKNVESFVYLWYFSYEQKLISVNS